LRRLMTANPCRNFQHRLRGGLRRDSSPAAQNDERENKALRA
jgi:hypothetical protein